MTGDDTVSCADCHVVLTKASGTVFGDDGMSTDVRNEAWCASVAGCRHEGTVVRGAAKMESTQYQAFDAATSRHVTKHKTAPMAGQVITDYCSKCGAQC